MHKVESVSITNELSLKSDIFSGITKITENTDNKALLFWLVKWLPDLAHESSKRKVSENTRQNIEDLKSIV